MSRLYPWMIAAAMQHDEVLRHKALYLNPTFFLLRAPRSTSSAGT